MEGRSLRRFRATRCPRGWQSASAAYRSCRHEFLLIARVPGATLESSRTENSANSAALANRWSVPYERKARQSGTSWRSEAIEEFLAELAALVGRVELDDTDRDGQTLLVSDPEAMAMAEIPIGTSSFTAQGWAVFSIRRAPEPWTVSRFTRRNSIRSSSTLSGSRLFTHSLAKPVGATGLNPSCRRAWLAFVSLRPVVLNLGVQALASLLHLRTFFVPIYQIRAEQIEFVIQSDELTH